jgi:hypothetical protein
VGEIVDLVIDARRGERLAIELPVSYRTSPSEARRALGLSEFVDLADPIVAKGIVLLDAARRADPPVHLAFLGGVAHRLRCPSSNRDESGLRRSLHDLDIACLHREVKRARAFLESAHASEGSGLRFFETSGDRIFNSLGEGRRLRYHMVIGQRDSGVDLGTVDLLADEFRFCHRFDLREDISAAPAQHGTLSLALLLLAKLQYIQRIPGSDRLRVPERVLEPYGRHEVVIGPESKDVRDILATLVDHPLDESPDGISPSRFTAAVSADGGLWKTVGLNLAMIARSPILEGLPGELRPRAVAQLERLRELLGRVTPKRAGSLFGGPWWEEVDAVPSVDATASVSPS